MMLVIVLCYNGKEDTLRCLESLRATSSPGIDVLVVHNGSTDGSQTEVGVRFPEFDAIDMPDNQGWAGGNNVGIKYALERNIEKVCLLNNDTIIFPGAMSAISDAMDEIGPCLMHPVIDYADSKDGSQLDPRQMGARRVEASEHLYELDFTYGACLGVSSEVFRKIGTFDERFFLQLEETDFWYRARDKDFKSFCTTNGKILHFESPTFGGRISPMKTYYVARNTLLLASKHGKSLIQAGRSLYWMISNLTMTGNGGRALPLWKWPWSDNPHIAAARAGVLDFFLGRFGRGRALLFVQKRPGAADQAR